MTDTTLFNHLSWCQRSDTRLRHGRYGTFNESKRSKGVVRVRVRAYLFTCIGILLYGYGHSILKVWA